MGWLVAIPVVLLVFAACAIVLLWMRLPHLRPSRAEISDRKVYSWYDPARQVTVFEWDTEK